MTANPGYISARLNPLAQPALDALAARTPVTYSLRISTDLNAHTFTTQVLQNAHGTPVEFDEQRTFPLSSAGHAEMLDWLHGMGLSRTIDFVTVGADVLVRLEARDE